MKKTLVRFGVAASAAFATLVATTAQEPDVLRSEGDPTRVEVVVRALENNLPYIPGELLVRFRPDVGSSQQIAALSVLSTDVARTQTRWIGDTLLLTGLTGDDAEHVAFLLSEQPEVAYAHPNYIQRLHSVPNDTSYSRQWNLNQINMPQAWDINTGAGRGITVAVLDTGLTTFDLTVNTRLPIPPSGLTFGVFAVPFLRSPDFDFSRVVAGTEFTPTGPWTLASGQRVLFDADGHGTHVAGTVAQQTNNSFGFAGVANGVTLMPVKVCFSGLDLVMFWGSTSRRPSSLDGGCLVSDVIQGIRYAADNGAKMLNLSIGGTGAAPAYIDALNYAVSRGAFVAISAGNSALAGNPIEYPAAYAADIKGVVAVGATTLRKTRALYSSFRSYVELAAPGGEGTATSCAGPTEVVWQIAPNPIDLLTIPPRFDRYAEVGLCGTSMASPHVAGAAALLYSQGINNPGAIEAALESLAEDLGQPGRDPDFGFGLIDARKAVRGLGAAR